MSDNSFVSFNHWQRSHDQIKQLTNDRNAIYQISKFSPALGREEVIASCSRGSATRLLAGLAKQTGPEQYRISGVFLNPNLPGLQPPPLHPGWRAARQAERQAAQQAEMGR